MKISKEQLEDKIVFVLSDDYCSYVIQSDSLDLSLVCEGDCMSCRLQAIMNLIFDVELKVRTN